MRTANRVRTPERAATAEGERTAALVGQLVEQLGQMRGAAMKIGQMISMVEFDGLPEDERDELQRRLAALRDDVPPVRFADLEKLMRKELGGPLGRVFPTSTSRLSPRPRSGRSTARGPWTARRWSSRSSTRGWRRRSRRTCETQRCCCRSSSGWPRVWTPGRSPGRCANGSPRSSTTSSRPRTSARRAAACEGTRSCAFRGSTPTSRRAACSCPSTSRASVSRPCAGRGGAARPLRRDRLPVLLRSALPRPDRARRSPSRQLPAMPRRPGLLPGLRPAARCRRPARRRRAGDRAGRPRRRRAGAEGGPGGRRLSARRPGRRASRRSSRCELMQMAIRWYACRCTGASQPGTVTAARSVTFGQRGTAAAGTQVNQFTLPPRRC